MLLGAIVLGCAAYQAGNILGAVSGLSLLVDWPVAASTALIGSICSLLLWLGSTRLIANLLGLIVFGMGIAFMYVAFRSDVTAGQFLMALVWPTLPTDAYVLVMGLIGTTIVPYNLFLASGIGQGQSLAEMRWGIGMAVLIGGFISMAILVSGTLVSGAFSFPNMANVLSLRLGAWSHSLFAFGLFAAGFTSCLTAPLAAAITARSLLGKTDSLRSYRLVWMIVMAVGLSFGFLKIRPIPVIVLAQAVNGVLLPVISVFLFRAVNNRKLIPAEYRNSLAQNLAMLTVVVVSLVFGGWNVWLALQKVMGE